jgi:integrase
MRSTKTSDKKVAMEVLKKIEEDNIRLSEGLEPQNKIRPLLLSEFIEYYLEYREKQRMSKKTISMDAYALNRLFDYLGDCNLHTITRSVVQRFRDHRLESMKAASVSIELRSLRAAFNWGVEKAGEKYLKDNPFVLRGLVPSVENKNIPKILSPEEKAKFFSVIENPEHELLFKFYSLTGCRRNEALNLCWTDIDLEQKQITFRKTKTKKDRSIPIGLELMQVILKLDQSKQKPFMYRPDTVTRQFKRYLKRAAIDKDLHLHNLRHTAASDLVRQGVHLTKIQKFLGHSSVKVTEIYTHVLPEDLREVAEALTCAG